MKVIVNAKYGTVLASASCVYYVPTKSPPWHIQSNATVEEWPELAREQVLDIPAAAGETVDYHSGELLNMPGDLSFTGKQSRAETNASDWALLRSLLGHFATARM